MRERRPVWEDVARDASGRFAKRHVRKVVGTTVARACIGGGPWGWVAAIGISVLIGALSACLEDE